MTRRFIVIDPEKDNVATAITDLEKGEVIKVNDTITVTLSKRIEMGHKFALKKILKGEEIIKFGHLIGVAKRDINPGDWVHSNIRSPYAGGKDADG